MIEIGDIAIFAEKHFDISYNAALSLFEKDKIIPGYETKYRDIYKDVGIDYGWSEMTTNIFNKYVECFGDQTIIL